MVPHKSSNKSSRCAWQYAGGDQPCNPLLPAFLRYILTSIFTFLHYVAPKYENFFCYSESGPAVRPIST